MTRRGADYRDNRWPGGADRGRPHRRRDRPAAGREEDRKSTRLNSSHSQISYAVFCLKKKKNSKYIHHRTTPNSDTIPHSATLHPIHPRVTPTPTPSSSQLFYTSL